MSEAQLLATCRIAAANRQPTPGDEMGERRLRITAHHDEGPAGLDQRASDPKAGVARGHHAMRRAAAQQALGNFFERVGADPLGRAESVLHELNRRSLAPLGESAR